MLLKNVSALQKGLSRGKLHLGFGRFRSLFGDNILLYRTPLPQHFLRKLFCRMSRVLQVALDGGDASGWGAVWPGA